MADFITECCEDWREHPQQGMRTPKERVYLAYCVWCKAMGEDLLSRNAFNSSIRAQGFLDKTAKLSGDVRAQKCCIHMTLKREDGE